MPIKLTEILNGKVATINQLSGDMKFKSRLVEMGLCQGTHIRVVRKSPFLGPIEIKIRDYYLTLRHQDAEMIIVTEIDG